MPLHWQVPAAIILLSVGATVTAFGVVELRLPAASASAAARAAKQSVGEAFVAIGVVVLFGSLWLLRRGLLAQRAETVLTSRDPPPSPALVVSAWGATAAELAQVARWKLMSAGGTGFRRYAYQLKTSRSAKECIAALGFLLDLATAASSGYDVGVPADAREQVGDAAAGCLAWAGGRATVVWDEGVQQAMGRLMTVLDALAGTATVSLRPGRLSATVVGTADRAAALERGIDLAVVAHAPVHDPSREFVVSPLLQLGRGTIAHHLDLDAHVR
jgi:hypothetical protein